VKLSEGKYVVIYIYKVNKKKPNNNKRKKKKKKKISGRKY
jgi:hypothetical protein